MKGPRQTGHREDDVTRRLLLLALLASTRPAWAQEDALVIRATTDETEAADLLAGFRALYPSIAVFYAKVNSSQLYDEFVADAASGRGTADIIWNAAMDLQIKLVNDGYAARYMSPEAEGLPPWAVWRNEAYGITAEPVAIAYNRKLLPPGLAPRTHADVARLLTGYPELWKGKVAAYDPERSGVGFLFLTQDLDITSRTWEIVRALGQVGVKLYTTTDTMLDRVVAGEALLAYNVFGAYALERARRDSSLGVVLPADYTLLTSRIAFIPKQARHPEAARLFMDFMLSQEGQSRLAARSVTPARPEARTPDDPIANAPALRPIGVGPALLTYLDQIKRARVLAQWRRAMEGR
jgi:iron(III) transport system substrate-binding protein